MNITTTYKTTATGAGRIEARCGDSRKTSTYDHSKSSVANHGLAAGALVLAAFPDQRVPVLSMIDNGYAEHLDLDGGKHRFVV